ncbi:MAG: hypothetical protein JWN34_2149 [Bryobacterales bacterium]|nr:hypothetical protein [Bryobacterales bacterium]
MIRCTRSPALDVLRGEAIHAQVIASLITAGDEDIANKLLRCQAARVWREPTRWPRRCGSGGCHACRRTLIRKWWSAFEAWPSDSSSLVEIPMAVPANGLTALKRLRRALRDLRDREARRHRAWRQVAFMGLAQGSGTALMVIEHPGLCRASLVAVLRKRWPTLQAQDVKSQSPLIHLPTELAADLARQCRGIEPIRIVIMPQALKAGPAEPELEPMPVLI